MDVSTTVSRRIDEPRDALWARFIPVRLEDILGKYGPVPAVTGTSGQTGPWDVVGSSRTVHLSDGSSATEQVTAVQAPQMFGYTVSGFTNPVRFLAREARGVWVFEESGEVRWTYTFAARSLPAALLLAPVVRFAWRGFMRRALDALAAG
ncbi:SRPBCC family protein [Baekduia sp. Peel2402]|uniref:SRPBCC family protein n=1 Tax=Baekduia sp. Peel2402 TaxID=3458296 RepID=UPI00403EA0FB